MFWYSFPEGDFAKGLQEASQRLGEQGFYISLAGFLGFKGFGEPLHWYVPYNEISAFSGQVTMFENVIYSINGQWAIARFWDDFGMMTCTESFALDIQRYVPNLFTQVDDFLVFVKSMRSGPHAAGWRIDAVPLMLDHLYGPVEAQAVLNKSGLIDSISE